MFSALDGALAVADHNNEGYYTYANVNEAALAAYRHGWVEILDYGRWEEAERFYRQALELDPDFIVARSVLARITIDADERRDLYRDVQNNLVRVDGQGRLILDVYQQTLELFIAREQGQALAPGFSDDMAALAVSNYRRFIDRYPREWSVVIEYVEWVHALRGPGAALEEIRRLGVTDTAIAHSFSYFPAYFYAELGQYDKALELAGLFEARFDDPQVPQPHYLNAYIAYEMGRFTAAKAHIDRALELAPGHLIAQRLRKKIEEAL
jgi:tetratricopeptide (TPR) repeat protein